MSQAGLTFCTFMTEPTQATQCKCEGAADYSRYLCFYDVFQVQPDEDDRHGLDWGRAEQVGSIAAR